MIKENAEGADLENERAEIVKSNFQIAEKDKALRKAMMIFKKYHDQIFYYKDELPVSWLDIANESAEWLENNGEKNV